MMDKIGFIVDGGSSLTEEECQKKNIKRIFFKIVKNDSISYNDSFNEITYADIDNEQKKGNFLKTSCSPIGEIMSAIDELLEKNDFVLIFTINKTLSSEYNVAKMLEQEHEYKNKIFVVDTQAQCLGLEYIILESQKMISNGKSIKEVIKFAEKENEYIYTSFVSLSSKPATSSGRLSKILVGKVLDKAKIFPILNMNQKISLNSISKSYNKALEKMVFKTKKIIEESNNTIKFISVYTSLYTNDNKNLLISFIKKEFNIKEKEIIMKKTPLVIFNNTGRDSFGLAVILNKKYYNNKK